MNYLGYISTEGGPLIISDSSVINNWDGIDGEDYEQLCEVFDSDLTLEGFNVKFKNYLPIAWELEGAGIVKIYRNNDDILLIKVWSSEKDSDLDKEDIINIPVEEEINIGNLILNTEFLFVFWATESLYNVKFDNQKEYGIPNGDFAMDDSIFFLKTSKKKYSCLYDKINKKGIYARRLRLIPK
ncbi:hypothetical protein [Dysgonomonas sp. 511]|uniref:hypothetical protein n=1 Tax=Dysgonomonas sp. 511 TaxID=2302930 RepID=UPI0013D8E0A9|nr:hypothetical protein [Dysgonomonas sp. 511]NDV78466.1 hypothetical protein [Dysgonomonas sp. 511]